MIALTAGRRGWSDALVLKPSQCIRPPYRARSTFMQRSITTERPPASAIRASSVVDAMHWAQRHRLQEGRSRVEEQPLAPARHPSSRRRPSAATILGAHRLMTMCKASRRPSPDV